MKQQFAFRLKSLLFLGLALGLVMVALLAVTPARVTYANSDVTAPSCPFINRDGPPARITFIVKDLESGLASISVSGQQNVTVDITSFTPGTTNGIPVHGIVNDNTQAAKLNITVTDVAGNSRLCKGHWRPEPGG